MHCGAMTAILVFTIVIGTMSQSSYARAQVSQTSFVHGGANGGYAHSRVVLGNTTKGQCSFIDESGKTITINYVETADGQLNATSEDLDDPEGELKKCREGIAQNHANFTKNFEASQQEFANQMDELEKNLQEQMSDLHKQQEAFALHQSAFMERMDDFTKQMHQRFGTLHASLAHQRQNFLHFNPMMMRFPFFR